MTLRLDDILTLYAVSGLSVGRIAARYGIPTPDVAEMLQEAGVAPRWRNRRVRNAADSKSGRDAWREADQPSAPARNPHIDHCLSVIRALGGRGFPFLATGDAASSA